MSQAAETYVIFELAGHAYALRSGDVQHIEMIEHVTPVPNAAPSVEGVVFSRGQVIPAMNLRMRFGFPRQAPTVRSRLIIVQAQKRAVALMVDAAREFRKIPAEDVRPIEQTLTGINSNYLQGVATVGDRMILIIDVARVLDLENLPTANELAENERLALSQP